MRTVIYLVTLALSIACMLNIQNGIFGWHEAILIMVCIVLSSLSLLVHAKNRRPSGLVALLATLIFVVAYIIQSILFIANARSQSTSLNDLIGLRSIFSVAALGANELHIKSSLEIIVCAFVGLFLAALLLGMQSPVSAGGKNEMEFDLTKTTKSTVWVGVVGVFVVLFFGALRKMFGLESAAPSGLPPGVGGIINIASAYVGPNLTYAAFFISLQAGRNVDSRYLALVSICVGLLNYILFTSKMSLVFPLLFILFSQFIVGRPVIKIKWLILFGGLLVIVYPFLNIYRSASALGVSANDLFSTIFDLYQMAQESSGVERGALQVALSSIVGRFVGYDPLMILLQADPYPFDFLTYMWDGDLDKYLTYEILNFKDSMGYSPGLVGRSYFISRSYFFVGFSAFAAVYLIGRVADIVWMNGGLSRYLAVVLMAYCLPFFSDGVRYELLRSLLFSAILTHFIIAKIFDKFVGD